MIWWWKGNGLMLAIFVAAIVAAAGRLGPMWMVGGFVVSAVIVNYLKDDESHLYSFRVKWWPPLLLVSAVLCFMGR